MILTVTTDQAKSFLKTNNQRVDLPQTDPLTVRPDNNTKLIITKASGDAYHIHINKDQKP